jgi:hypothetical protein
MDTLASCLELIRTQLNAALQAAEPGAEDWVILANVTGQDGVAFADARDKIAMMLVNIASDAAPRASPRPRTAPPPARLDLLVVFLANFENQNYPKGLAAIARTIAFFQKTPVFVAPNAGGETISMQATELTLAEVGNVMRMLGVNYRPSAFYRLRGVPVG